MALSYTNRVVRGKDQSTLTVSTSPDVIVMLDNNLTSFDKTELAKADALIDGGAIPDLLAALAEHTMPNGQTADVYYATYLIDVDAVNAAFIPNGEAFKQDVASRLSSLEADVADHEARITALEP